MVKVIGQFPDTFTGAVLLNPVISADPVASDIPDWYSNEWKIEIPCARRPELRAADLRDVSDGTRRRRLGDLRVTPSHGLEYYHTLKGLARKGQDVEMHWFQDADHSLDGVEVARMFGRLRAIGWRGIGRDVRMSVSVRIIYMQNFVHETGMCGILYKGREEPVDCKRLPLALWEYHLQRHFLSDVRRLWGGMYGN
ncbi:hypothetical protein FB451DRAFT_1172683 [Mycena latifolia]|nr:hypothetical protein FB451DRAFT_1172683 [Mycena latifolia]